MELQVSSLGSLVCCMLALDLAVSTGLPLPRDAQLWGGMQIHHSLCSMSGTVRSGTGWSAAPQPGSRPDSWAATGAALEPAGTARRVSHQPLTQCAGGPQSERGGAGASPVEGSRMRSRCAAMVCSGGGRFCTSFRRPRTMAWNLAMRRFPSLTSCNDRGGTQPGQRSGWDNLQRAGRCSMDAVCHSPAGTGGPDGGKMQRASPTRLPSWTPCAGAGPGFGHPC